MKVKDVEKEISAKRNKDLVASYSLIPLLKDKQKMHYIVINSYKNS